MPYNATDYRALPEADLVDMAIAGSAPAFGELAERHRDKLHRHFAFRSGSLDDADDLTQEAFARAWAAIGRFRRTSSPFIAWLMTIAHNLLVDRARSASARHTVSFVHRLGSDWEALERERDGAAWIIDEDRWCDPAWRAEWAEDAARLRDALDRLDAPSGHMGWARAPYRAILVRCYARGQSFDAIAAEDGLTAGNARIRAHRGRLALRRLLAEPAGVAS